MTSSGSTQSIGQSKLDIRSHEEHRAPLPTSIGACQLISSHSTRPTATSRADSRVVKPWAHLVAGGCVSLVANAQLAN